MKSISFLFVLFLGAALSITASCKISSTDCHPGDPYCNPALTAFLMQSAAPAGFFFQWPDTGQSDCFDNSIAQTCPFGTHPGQDAEYNLPAVRAMTADRSGFAVYDANTNLYWQRCVHGMSYDGSTCTGAAISGTDKATAESVCSATTLEGRAWRLPTMREGLLLMDYGKNPTLDAALFPAHPALAGIAQLWTSKAYAPTAANSWIFYPDIGGGFRAPDVNTTNFYTQCVSGDQIPEPDLTTVGELVRDETTGLEWTRCPLDGGATTMNATSVPLTGTSCASGTAGTGNWLTALQACDNLVHEGHSDWRLASIGELASILGEDENPPTFTSFFPATASTFWASTTDTNPASAFTFSESTGNFAQSAKTNNEAARCVRGP